MTELRRPKGALSLGDAVPVLGHATHAPPRHCTRCGARLRHANHLEHCAPCHDQLYPWTMPEMRTRKSDECPSCGNLKQRVSKRCRRCANQGIRLDFTGHTPL